MTNKVSDERPASDQQVTTNKNDKNDKNGKNEKNIDIYTSFSEFWNAYPRKVGKKAAMLKYNRIRPELHAKIMAALEAHKQSKQWQNPMYIPHPTTWLNQERWDDEGVTLTLEQQMDEDAKNMDLWTFSIKYTKILGDVNKVNELLIGKYHEYFSDEI